MYLYKTVEQMIWPYDDRCRLVGEDVWEPDPDKAELTKLDPADVLTTEESARQLAPLIVPLPSFEQAVLGKAPAPVAGGSGSIISYTLGQSGRALVF